MARIVDQAPITVVPEGEWRAPEPCAEAQGMCVEAMAVRTVNAAAVLNGAEVVFAPTPEPGQ